MNTVLDPNDLAIVADPLLGASTRDEVVFIESDVKDIDVLLAGIAPGKEVHVIDAGEDGLQQIAGILQGRSGIDALYIVSHGAQGEAGLGSLLLDSATATSHASELKAIGQSLASDADILLYGCDVGAGATGQALVGQLAVLTGADIAASDDPTGAAALGGDWDLEVRSGDIEAKPLVDTYLAAVYRDVLALSNQTVTFGTDANFAYRGNYHNGAASDVTYRVNNNASYTLKIDGAADTVYSYYYTYNHGGAGNDYVTLSSYNYETSVTVSFQAGNLFTLTSLGLDDFLASTGDTIVFKGYDSSNAYVSGASTNLTTDGSGMHTVTFTGGQWANLASIKITQSSGTQVMKALGLDDFVFAAIQAAGPVVTDAKISISGASGTGGAFKIGDTVTAHWDNTLAGDNNSGITGVTMDFSAFGGGTTVVATNASGIWTATYTIVAGGIDATNRNVSVTATDSAGSTTTADTTNATVDSIAPTVSDARISLSGATGTGGAFKIGDIVTATWNNTAGGDNNSDTVSAVTADFSAFGGGSAVVASNVGGSWSASYTITAGAIDGTNKNVSIKATDNAGNTTTTADTTNATVDSVAPTVTDANINVSGASGTGGAFRIGDTVTATWTDTGGDSNSDTISGVTMDFSAFGGGSAVVASGAGGIWTATYTITSGAVDGTNRNVSVTATDNAGNTTTTADTTNATVDSIAPTVSDAKISLSGATGTGGAFRIGDTVTATWTDTGGDNNSDAIPGVTVDFSAFGGGSAVVASNAGGVWTATYTITAGAIDGTNKNVSVTATDNAGNTTTTADTTNATVDSVAPAVSDARISIAGASGTGGAFRIGDTVTATWDNTIGGDNNTDTISGVTVDFSQFGGGSAVVASNVGGTWTATYTITAGAIDGVANRNVSVTATDNAGNTTTVADSTNATVDNVAPATTVASAALSADTGSSSSDFITKTAAQTISGTTSANIASGEIVEVSIDNGATWNAATTTVGQNTWSIAATLTASDTLVVRVTDSAGNTGAAFSQAYVLDTSVPAAPSTPDMTAGSDSGSSNTDNDTNNATATFNGTAEAGSTVTLFDTDGVTVLGTGTATGGNWSITASALSEGSHTLTAKATDTAGNVSSASTGLAVTIDTTSPTVSSVSVPSDGSYKAGDTLDFTVDLSEAVTVDTTGGTPRLALTLGASTAYASYVSGSGTGALLFRYTVQAGDNDSDGIAVSTFEANGATLRDTAGNDTNLTLNGIGSTASVLVDTTAPTVTDANIAISGGSGTGGAFRIGDTVTATWNNTAGGDNNGDVLGVTMDFSQFGGGSAVVATSSSGNWIATYTIVSGAIDGLANVNVSVTASDVAGNATTTADSTNATVDSVAPTVTGVTSATANGNYHPGDVLSITVDFSEAVTVTGTPQLTLETGSTDRAISYAGGSGTSTLTFSYTVQVGDTSADLDYIGTSALSLNGGAIVDASGNGAVLTLAAPGAAGSLGANADVQINVNNPAVGPVVASGTATQGQTLTADTSGLSDPDGLGTFSYQWMRDGSPIVLATGSTYLLTQTDVGAAISVEVSYTDGWGHSEVITSADTAAVANVNDAPTGNVAITGTPALGQMVSADTSSIADLDGLGTFSFQWLRDGTPIGLATSQDYAITAADIGALLTVQVSYDDGFGAHESLLSLAVAPTGQTTGNSGRDVLTGGAGNDTLDGGEGPDTMTGGAGDDTYYVDSGGDKVIEAPGAGNDTVFATHSYALTDNVENLFLIGRGGLSGEGNDLDNQITGNDGPNRLTGGLGADTLTGGDGADRFIIDAVAESPAGVGTYDVITDFDVAGRDRIDLHKIDIDPVKEGVQGFHYIGTNAFSATDATGELRFDAATHMLYGSTNADAAAEFAVLLVGVTDLPAQALVV